MLYGGNSARLVYVITTNEFSVAICDRILKELDIGATYVDGEGAYTGEQRRIIMCAVKNFLYPKIRDIVKDVDPHAFMIVSSAKEIYGEGYIDLGLDNTFDFDGEGGLLGVNEGTWLAVEGQPVAYYHTATVDDGTSYAITGRVPVLHNGSRSELILTFDTERPQGYVAGVQTVYLNGETDTVAKSQSELQPGDTLEFLCDYYSYDGDYQDSYLLGDPLIVTEEELTVGDVPLDGVTPGVLPVHGHFRQAPLDAHAPVVRRIFCDV